MGDKFQILTPLFSEFVPLKGTLNFFKSLLFIENNHQSLLFLPLHIEEYCIHDHDVKMFNGHGCSNYSLILHRATTYEQYVYALIANSSFI